MCLVSRNRPGAARNGFTIVGTLQGVGWRNIDVAKQRIVMHAMSRVTPIRIKGALILFLVPRGSQIATMR